MAIYIVLSESNNPGLGKQIAELYPDDRSFKLNEQQWLIVDDKLANTISQDLNLAEGGAGGRTVIFRIASGGVGWHRKSLWEWLALKGTS